MSETSQKTVPARQDHPFEVSSITPADAPAEAPAGAASATWYRYVIAQGKNSIVGHREGSLKAVTEAVKDIVLRLNERRLGKSGRVHLTPGPKKSRGT